MSRAIAAAKADAARAWPGRVFRVIGPAPPNGTVAVLAATKRDGVVVGERLGTGPNELAAWLDLAAKVPDDATLAAALKDDGE